MKVMYIVKRPLFTTLVLSFILLSGNGSLFAQSKKAYKPYNSRKPNKISSFLDTQWWLGLKGGVNISKAVPITRYAVFSPIGYGADELYKTYNSFNRVGMQAGIEITFYHKGWSFSFQPNYNRQIFDFYNSFTWFEAEIPDQNLELRYDHSIYFDVIELPLIIKYDILKSGKVRPFIQGGGYFSILGSVENRIETTGTDNASGATNPFSGETLVFGVTDLYNKSTRGLMGGAGVNYDLWKIRIVFDIMYRHGMNNITNEGRRYTNNSLSGLGTTMDDVSLNNITFNLGFLFPLRFISKDFKAID